MPNPARSSKTAQSFWLIGVMIFLVTTTALVFGQTLWHDFINYDDPTYVYANPIVTHGVTSHGLAWAFTHAHARNWHPLTTISHMIDCQLFGLNAGGHHFTNLLLHCLSVVLLFFFLQRMTGSIWRSAFVAALFAVHPLRVESVAWIAERKDVLSGFFFVLTLGAYSWYARRPSLGRYIALSLLFALGLMAKPMLVTLPFLLLLLDYWPLHRMQEHRALGLLLVEKIPLLALSAGSCVATVLAQSGPIGAMEPLPLSMRINNAIVSYVTYLRQMFWPVDLAPFYSHPGNSLPTWQIAGAALLVLGITVLALVWARKRPYFIVGWLWYLGLLLPVIGIFQIGMQGHADRYTYLPQIGLYLLLAWTVGELSILRQRPQGLFALSAIVLLFSAGAAWDYTSVWKNSETLWKHALNGNPNNDVAHFHLGLAYSDKGNFDAALSEYQKALTIQAARVDARYKLETALTYNNIAALLDAKHRLAEAAMNYEKAIELRPDYADAHYNLGKVYWQQGRLDDAINQWQAALSIQPTDGDIHRALGRAFLQKGSVKDAIDHYEQAIRATNPSVPAASDLAWILATSPDDTVRNGQKALALAAGAVGFTKGREASFLRSLAAAYAENKRFDDAVKTAQRAIDLARSQNNSPLADNIEKDLDLYRTNTPFRDQSLANAPTTP